MGKGRRREVEKGVLGLGKNSIDGYSSGCGTSNVPAGPTFYPTEDEFKDPLEYINKIRPEAEPYGICKIVPPNSWKPPFALDMDSFTFPTKTQAIHQLQARSASCDPKTFALEYNSFLEEQCGKKAKKNRVVFEREDLDMCKLFNAVKRFGGYDKVAKAKKWGEVFRFVRPGAKISECSKHVLSQLYLEHLYEYEEYYRGLNKEKDKSCKNKRGSAEETKNEPEVVVSYKRRRRNKEGDSVKVQKVDKQEFDQTCEQCKSGLHGEVMLLCDRCNKGWHIYCLSPPMKSIPPGNWYCLECLNSEKDTFGFIQGKRFSIEGFKRVADRVKKKWFGSVSASRVQLEKKFWEIVEGSAGEVEVIYGSDLDTSVYGSGFPNKIDQNLSSVEVELWNEYCNSPWNLNNLPRLKGSMLRAVQHNIAGVMVPWLYVGMLFSSFCWHFEDHCFYSMNYHHWGEPKCWYSVPGNEAHNFEKVMRDCLPDLFEAQPDLLFQLVTMLNPSVLLEKGVPVYSIIQEPGNFVITFPRSYHGGFNFGLNCAEAVNFAPADWLPHGGIGAELYRHYHKAAVLSHEELLCVVAKGEIDGRFSTYLRTELLRIYNNEKTWRERLWRHGIVKSSPMVPREQPDCVGAEEDPVCIICQQILYLSAVSCKCRPSTFVCVEHWAHLCECRPNKLCLLYRHTLAELHDLIEVGQNDCNESPGNSRKEPCSEKTASLAKKVKGGGRVTHVQLAEDWILRSCEILELPYSGHAFASAIEEAEQFMWAGSEMDLVRDMSHKLVQSRNWAESVRDCVSKVKLWSSGRNCGTKKKIQLEQINELLKLHNVPCNEPSYIQLKEYQKEAAELRNEVNSALSVSIEVSMAEWEILHGKALDSPIHIKECEKLEDKISAVKVWLDNVRKCIKQKTPSVELEMLYKLEKEILELQIQLPEAELLAGLITKAKSCQSRCNDLLKSPIILEELKLFLSEWEDYSVNVPELNLLRKYYNETTSWICRVNIVLENVHEREDRENVVDELTCIQKDGSLLHIHIEELPRVELELKRACCRVNVIKALRGKTSMESIQQVMFEATELQIKKEKLFTDLSRRYADAISWEEKARYYLDNSARISEFEDVLRASEDIGIILPSLLEVSNAVSVAKAWLIKAKPFVFRDLSTEPDSCLQVDVLKALVLESEHLRVYMEERGLLHDILKKCIDWEHNASSLLQETEQLWNIEYIGGGIRITNSLNSKFDCQVSSIDSAIKAGLSLGLEFTVIPKLRDACSMLKWFNRAFSFSAIVPTLEEVEMMLESAANLPVLNQSSGLLSSLTDGLNWLKKALEILEPRNIGKFGLSSVEEVLVLSKKTCMSFPMIIDCLQGSIKDHNLWLVRVDLFFGLSTSDRSWNELLQLKEHGQTLAFSCVELEKVLSEVDKVQQWKRKCEEIIKPATAQENPLMSTLIEVKDSLERSFDIYSNSRSTEARTSCTCCSSSIEYQEHLTCSICKDSFHLHCAKPGFGDGVSYVCSYCDSVKSCSKLPLKNVRKRVELDKLEILLTEANSLCLWTDERMMVHQIVEKALACKVFLTEIVDFALAYVSEDLNVVTGKMSIALKAMEVAYVFDGPGNKKFELALAQKSWKIKAEKLSGRTEKPTMQQIQQYLKEGLAINIPSEDYYRTKLTEFRDMGQEWANTAKKVSVDGGVLELDRVFEFIFEGENLPVSCGRELKLLRDRSMLYCICRKPYDQRAMIACDQCDEWYHFDCIKISSAPKVYICPACDGIYPKEDASASAPIAQERFPSSKFEEPHTPLRRSELRRNSIKPKSELENVDIRRNFIGSDKLLWRSRKPFRRASRKRSELKTLSPFFYVQNKLDNEDGLN